jgi:hypothetical protein
MSNTNLLETRRQGSKNQTVIVPLYRTLSARELFPVLREKRLAARPVVGQDRGPYKLDKTGRKRYFNKPTPIFGESTFRNVIENGKHV